VNDKHGHPRGDEVLRAAAATLKKALRTSDSAFRIGGDEFALLLPQTDAEQALALSRRVETVFAEVLQPLQLTVGVSMDHGVATFPQDGEQVDQLIRVADERLYRLKQANHGKSGNGGTRTQAEPAPPEARSAAERPTAPPAPISIESGRVPDRSEPQPQPPAKSRPLHGTCSACSSSFFTRLCRPTQGRARLDGWHERVRHARRTGHTPRARS